MCERNWAATCSNHAVMTRDDTWFALLRRPGWVKNSDDVLDSEAPRYSTPRQYTHTPERAEHALSDYYSNRDFFVGIMGDWRCSKPYSPWTRADCARAAWGQSIIKDGDMI
jgi:hypothetical protein